MSKCMRCEKKLRQGEEYIHASCLTGFWPKKEPFIIPISLDEIEAMALDNVMKRITIPGVQPKLSLGFRDDEKKERITIVGAMQGDYILKPPHHEFPQMPEMEATCMKLVEACEIETVPYSLIKLKSGETAYITKRIDRKGKDKIAMEDFCQLTEQLTEHKYRGSHEKISKAIIQYARNPLIEVVKFYELVLACFIMGNNDMHLKNFSLIRGEKGYRLCPAYDIVSSKVYLSEDHEELALHLNGKKSKISKKDFVTAMKAAKLSDKAIENLFERVRESLKLWEGIITRGHLNQQNQNKLLELIKSNTDRIYA